jgi:hypothetical protein
MQAKLDMLSKFVLTESNFEKSLCLPKPPPKIHGRKHAPVKGGDTLFWCLYIIRTSLFQYEIIHNKFQVEQETKFKMIEDFSKSTLYKLHKIKKTDVESNLSENVPMSYASLHMACVFYGFSCAVVVGDLYFVVGTEEPTYEIHKKEKVYFLEDLKDHAHLYKVDSYAKPLKPISNYKSNDLCKIATQLNIPVSTKKVMYEAIRERLTL